MSGVAEHTPGRRRRALVTGASSGVGAGFARVLSAAGHDLVLVGRDRRRLEATAAGLAGSAQVVVADLTSEPDLARVEAMLADPATAVDLLVNNAGAGWYGSFVEQEPELLGDTVALNVTAVLRCTRAALPAMLAHGRGGVVNVSSVAGSAPSARMAVYAATKAFVDSWSASLALELHGTGVGVTCVRPGYVRTDFHARSGEDLQHVPEREFLSPDDVARRALAAHRRGRTSVVVLPELPPVGRALRSVRAWTVRRMPWVRDVKRAVTADR